MNDDEVVAELRASEELNRKILEAVPAGVVHVSIEGAILVANAEAQRILGLSYDAITHRYTTDWDSQTLHEDGSPCLMEDYPVTLALTTGEAQPPKIIGVKRPDGEIAWAIFTAVPVKAIDGDSVTGAVVTFLDITERRAVEDKLADSEARVAMSDRLAAVGTLAAGVAHEINNPLTCVLANIEMVADAMRDMKELRGADQLVRLLEEGNDGARRIQRIVSQLGNFARQGEAELRLVDLEETVEGAVRMVRSQIRYRARLVRAYGDAPSVRADPDRLGQVFVNLLANAAQAIDEGDVDGNEIRIRTFTTPQGSSVVEITDTGRGIPPEMLRHVFDPFVTTKGVGEGSGLGLHICRGIVQNMNGAIRIERSDSRGTVVHVELPPAISGRPEGSADVLRPGGEPTPVGGTSRARYKILVVDDDVGVRASLRRMLAPHRVTEASSGREAIACLSAADFDVIVCDLIMPDLTGMDVYDHICRFRPALSDGILFITGGAYTPRAREFIERVDNAVFGKPFDTPKLVAEVERLAAMRRAVVSNS